MNNKGLWLLAAIMTGALASQTATADYLAYSVGDREKSPLPERLDGIEAKYLLNVAWGKYNGRKSRLGVLPVDNNSSVSSFTISSSMGNVDYSTSSAGVPLNGIEAIVIDSLAQTERFRLVERSELGNVLQEQDLATSGRVAAPSAAATGNVLGAEYLVQVVITDYESNTSGNDAGVGGLLTKKVPLLGGVKGGSSTGRVGINVRLIDAETSEITFTRQIESVIRESNLSFGGIGIVGDLGLGGFMSSYSKTPIGQAVIAGINQGVYELVKQVGARTAEGSVVKADGTQVYVNLGQDSVSAGDRLQVLRKGEELIDPDTGISLGGSTTPLGEIEVVQVQEKFCIARPVTLSSTPERGDKVMATAKAAPLEFAARFKEPG